MSWSLLATTPSTEPNIDICHKYLAHRTTQPSPPISWPHGLQFIASNYTHDPPDFRSTHRQFLKGKMLNKFRALMADVIFAIVESSKSYDPSNYRHDAMTSPAPFWWLLCHLEMLILAPTTKHQRDGETIVKCLTRRIALVQQGDI